MTERYDFCEFISDEDTRCKVELPKCQEGYEMCSVWYDKHNGLEEEVLFIGAPVLPIRGYAYDAS